MAVTWIELELNRGHPVEKQADDIVKTFETLYKQAEQQRVPNVGKVVKAVKLLRAAILERVAALEDFYRDNDVDPRSSRFEAARVKLKRLLKNCPELPEEKPVAASTTSGAPNINVTSNATPARPTAATPPPGHASSASMRHPPNNRSASPAADKTVVIRVIMTHEEYEDVKLRRDALRQMMMSNSGATLN